MPVTHGVPDKDPPGGATQLMILSTQPSEQDQIFRQFAFAQGLGADMVAIPELLEMVQHPLRASICVAATARTLAALYRTIPQDEACNVRYLLLSCAKSVFVFDCQASDDEAQAVRWLSDGAVSDLRPVDRNRKEFFLPHSSKAFTRQIAGLGFSTNKPHLNCTLELRDRGDVVTNMEANGEPVYIAQATEGARIIVCCTPAPNLEQSVNSEDDLSAHYDHLIPVLSFLRHEFGERCWNAAESSAHFIIDDPLLVPRYGFLDYAELRRSMHDYSYRTSIAFIPWNHWRTSRKNGDRLMADANLSICVHGCDHLNREFASAEASELANLSVLAMERMARQECRTGISFDPVMVFPQGKFNKAAVSALRQAGFLAALNTNPAPEDTVDGDLTLGDLLQPAVSKFFGLPVFARRYPKNLMALAFDLFLGRPALIVEHHEYFRAGYGALQELVATLYRLDPTLSWPPLAKLVTRSCLMKVDSSGSAEILFFTNTFEFSNRSKVPRRFLLSKQEPNPSRIATVLCDAVCVPYKVENEYVRIEVEASPGQTCNVTIVDVKEQANSHRSRATTAKSARVLLRRGLSEFRDNVLANHAGPLRLAQRCASALKLTGDAAVKRAHR